MNVEQSMKVSAIIDKLELKIVNPKASQEEVGADLIMQMVSKAYKAADEIYSLIADLKKITILEAKKVDIMDFIEEVSKIKGLKSFFTYAVK